MARSKKKAQSLMVTDLAEFYRCDGTDGPRFYAATQSNKAAAIDYNGGTLPATVRGFGVYDTTVTMGYAVAIYTDKAEAEAHESTPAPETPVSIFGEEDEYDPADDYDTSDEEDIFLEDDK